MESGGVRSKFGLIFRAVKGWLGRFLRPRVAIVFLIVLLLSSILAVFNRQDNASSVLASAPGDAVLFYGASGNTTPQARTYTKSSNTFGGAGGTVAGATPAATMIRTSPKKFEAIAGYVNSTGTLQIMCYNGISWTNEWSVSISDNGFTRPFDIAYETNSGDVVVLYGTNTASATNPMNYRTKAASSGCGSANWSGATNLPATVKTTEVVRWVKLAPDLRTNSDLIAAAWADDNSDLSAFVWSGSAWGNEHTAALATTLEVAAGAQDVDSFDLTYESTSGDLMVAWGIAGTGTTNLIKYATCTGGTSGCTWAVNNNIGTVADAATNIDIASSPDTDEISMIAVDNGGGANSCDMSTAYWSGSAWTGRANVDTTVECPSAGMKLVSTFWLVNDAVRRYVVMFDDSAGTAVSWYVGNGSAAPALQTDFAASPAINDIRYWYDSDTNPYDRSQGMLTLNDTNNALFSKRLSMDAGGVFTWTNADGAASLGTLSQSSAGDFSFAYWRSPPRFEQIAYRWYNNADSVQPGSALGNENTPITVTSRSTILRLRAALANSGTDLTAGSQTFKLQYANATTGPWIDIADPTWCNDTTGITCTSAWSNRRKISFDNSSSATNLTDFPVLIKLTSANIDYNKTQNAGQDIRFVDPANPNVVLPHEIEQWDENGTSLVWVKVPQIDAGSTSDAIWMYYSNPSISSGQDVTNTWDSNYKGVWHLKETPNTSMEDSTTNNNDGTPTNMEAADQQAGQIGGGLRFDQTDEHVNLNTVAADIASGNLTMSFWFSPTSTFSSANTAIQTLFTLGDASSNNDFYMMLNEADGKYTLQMFNSGAGAIVTASPTSWTGGVWYYVTAVFSTTSGIKLYVNGNQDGADATNTRGSSAAGTARLGLLYENSYDYAGKLDEVRASTVARSADWVQAEYKSTNDTFTSFSGEESQLPLWKFKNNATPADGATISSALLSGTPVVESYEEDNPTAINPTAINTGQRGEWDFALDPQNLCTGVYYFRLVAGDGTVLTTYTNYPQLTIDAVAAPLDQSMRHGASFKNEVKQPYSCEWVGG